MIAVNVYCNEKADPYNKGYDITLAGVVNDVLDFNFDIKAIKKAIENDSNFKLKEKEFHEIHLTKFFHGRNPEFKIDRVIKKRHTMDQGWV